MGAVYIGQRGDRTFAIKFPTATHLDPGGAERFRREALLLSKVDDPHVVKINLRGWRLASGELFTQADLDTRAKVVVLGQTTAKQLFGGSGPVGKSVRIKDIVFTVAGVLTPKGADDDDVAVLPPHHVRREAPGRPRQDPSTACSSSRAPRPSRSAPSFATDTGSPQATPTTSPSATSVEKVVGPSAMRIRYTVSSAPTRAPKGERHLAGRRVAPAPSALAALGFGAGCGEVLLDRGIGARAHGRWVQTSLVGGVTDLLLRVHAVGRAGAARSARAGPARARSAENGSSEPQDLRDHERGSITQSRSAADALGHGSSRRSAESSASPRSLLLRPPSRCRPRCLAGRRPPHGSGRCCLDLRCRRPTGRCRSETSDSGFALTRRFNGPASGA
jgi:hypothetical protein